MTLSPEEISKEATKHKKEMLDELKKLAEKHAIDSVLKLRAELDAIRKAGDMDALAKLRQGGSTTDEHGRQVTLWENVLRQADRAIHSEQNSYNDWRSAMMSLLTLYSGMVKASDQASSEYFAPVFIQIKQLLRDNVAVYLKDKCLDMLKGDPKVNLPLLIHQASLSDDNKLNLGLSRSDGVAQMSMDMEHAPDKIKNSFDLLVNLWLLENGFSPKEAGPGEDKDAVKGLYVRTGTDEIMTKAEFTALKDDEEHGLAQFLETGTALRFQPKL